MHSVALTSARIVVYGLIGTLIGCLFRWVFFPVWPLSSFTGSQFDTFSTTNLLVSATVIASVAGVGSEIGRVLARRSDVAHARRVVIVNLLIAMLLCGGAYCIVAFHPNRNALDLLILLAALLVFAFAAGILAQAMEHTAESRLGCAASGMGTASRVTFGLGLGLTYLLLYRSTCLGQTCRFDFGPLFGLFLGLIGGSFAGLLLDFLVTSTLTIGHLINQRLLPHMS